MRSGRAKQRLRNQNARFLIVSEGALTEQQYLNAVKRSRRLVSADIKFVPPGPTSPLEIVLKARELRDQEARTDPFDSVWCIFDVEAKVTQQGRPKLAEALNTAIANGISVALSNPCVELWLLLHVEDIQYWVPSNVCQSRCGVLNLVSSKQILKPDDLIKDFQIARARALALESKHDRNRNMKAQDRNPSSTVYKLVDAICAAFPAR